MIASAPSQVRAASAARILGTIPPAMTPASMSASASPTVSLSSRRPSASRTPSTSVRARVGGRRGPLRSRQRLVGVDVADDPVLVPGERRDDRHLAAHEDRVEQVAPQPDDVGDEAEPGTRSAMSSPPSTPDRPTASTPEVAQPCDELAVDDAAQDGRRDLERGASVTRSPPSNRLGTPSRSSHSVIRRPPPWTRTTGRRRATAATSVEDLAWSAIVVPPSLTTRIFAHVVYSEFSMT